MESSFNFPELFQTFLSTADLAHAGNSMLAITMDSEMRRRERQDFYKAIANLGCSDQLHSFISQQCCPYPVLVPREFLENIKQFHEILSIAIVNIMGRWWVQDEGDLPSRMPLEPHEEELLKWTFESIETNTTSPFDAKPGHWRPDILIPTKADSKTGPAFMVCEINARSPFNSMVHVLHQHQVTHSILTRSQTLESVSDGEYMWERFLSLFDPKLPIHIVWEEVDNISVEAFSSWLKTRTGTEPRIIRIQDLRLLADHSSSTGCVLCCVVPDTNRNAQASLFHNGEAFEPIYQVGLQLSYDHYRSLPRDLLRHLAIHGVVDMHAIFLLNDKRILGIILQELHSLVHQYKVLSPRDAEILREGIVPTILPGSPELVKLLDQIGKGTATKSDFIVKPARGHRGQDILFGADISSEEWDTIVADMRDPAPRAGQVQYVLQPVIHQSTFDLVLDENSMCRSPLVGTYHAINGTFTSFGCWRSGNGRICSVNGAKGFLLHSVTPRSS